MCTYHFFKKKKIVEWICGNGITEIGGKIFFVAIGLWQCHCRKWEEKKIVVAEIWEGIKKKVLRPQYFYNKSHVISY